MKTTRRELETLTAILAGRINVPLVLDHNSTYGGWTIRRSHGRFGGEAFFGDSGRVAAKDLAFAIRLALAALAAADHVHTWERRAESARVPSGETWEECRCGSVRL